MIIVFKISLFLLICHLIYSKTGLLFMRINIPLTLRLVDEYKYYKYFFTFVQDAVTPKLIRYIVYFNPVGIFYMTMDILHLRGLYRGKKKKKITLKEAFNETAGILKYKLNITEDNFKESMQGVYDLSCREPLYKKIKYVRNE